jgi:hypothetical protein
LGVRRRKRNPLDFIATAAANALPISSLLPHTFLANHALLMVYVPPGCCRPRLRRGMARKATAQGSRSKLPRAGNHAVFAGLLMAGWIG